MKVIPCGTHITIKLSKTEAIITAISIRFTAVSYECSYFAGQEYKQVYLNEQEFDFTGKRNIIGFQK